MNNRNQSIIMKSAFRQEAETQWAQLYSGKEMSMNVETLQNLAREAQIRQIELELYNDVLLRDKKLLQEANQVAEIGVWELDLETGNVYWSEVTKAIREVDIDFEPRLEDLIKYYKEGKDREVIEVAVNEAIDVGKGYDLELVMVTGKGNERWVRSIGKAVMKEGKCVTLFGVIQDITNRKKSEELLRKTTQKLQAIFNGSNDAVMLYSNGKFFDCNPKTLEMFGMDDKSKFTALHPSELSADYQPDGTPSFDAANQKIASAIKHGSCRFEWLHKRFNNELFYADVSLSVINYAGEKVVQAVVRDISEQKEAEKKLKASEEKFRSLTESSPDNIMLLDAALKIRYINYTVLDLTKEQVLGASVFDFIPKAYQKIAIDNYKRGFETGESCVFETQYISQDGDVHYFEVRTSPIFDGERVSKLLVVASDITNRKNVQTDLILSKEKLEASEEKFRAITEQASEAITIVDLDGNYVFANAAFCALTGYSQEELQTKKVVDMRANPQEKRLFEQAQHESTIGEIALKRKDGSSFLASTSAKPILIGKKQFILGVIKDISQEREAAQELQHSKDQLELLFELSPDFMLKSRISDLKFVDINQRACKFYGYSKEEFQELDLYDIEMAPPGEEFKKNVYNPLPIGEVLTVEGVHRKKDGTIFPVLIRVCKLDAEFELAAVTDITEQKKRDAELKKLSLVAQKTDNAVIILDENTHIEWVNEGFEKMTGYTSAEAIGQSLNYLLAGEVSAWNLEEQLLMNTNKNKSSLFEMPGYKKNKQMYWRSTSITPFKDSNDLTKYIVIESDITEQKRIANVLKEREELAKAKKKAEDSEKRLNEAQSIARMGNWQLDLVTGEELWSDELYRIFELSPDDVEPSEAAFLKNLHPDDRAMAHDTYTSLIKSQKAYQITYRLLLHNGKLKYVSERCQGEFDENGNHLRSLGTLQDITEQKEGEENLKKSIKEIQDLKYALDQSAMVVTINQNSKIITANANFCKVSGFDEEELIGEDFNMGDMDYHSKWFLKNLWETVKRGEVWKGTLKNKTKNKTVYWVDTAIVPFMDEQKNAVQFVIIQRDITEKKRLEEELEQANEAEFAKLYKQQKVHIEKIEERGAELDRFFNLSMDMISVITPEGYVKRMNPAFSKVLGYSESEIFSRPLLDFIHKDDLEKTKSRIQQIIDGEDIMNFENRYRTKSGEYRWMSWRAVLDRETQLRYAITRDITEEKIASRKIEELTYTLNQTAIVMIVNRAEEIISVNDKFCEISGYSKEEVIGKHHEILDSFHHSDEFWITLRETIESGKIWQGEIKERAKDGSFYWTDTSSVPFLDEHGEPFQYIVIQTDITERKLLEGELRDAKEEAIKNAKIKEDFLANMSHEIRTPMSGVLGFSRLLLQTNMDKTQRNYAQSIYSSAENLLVVVNDILDVSKIESGKFQLDEVEFNLEKRIRDTLNILRVSIQAKKLDLIINIDPIIPAKIIGAPNRIAQILINLIGNSVKFTKEGFIELKVQLLEPETLLFEVKDTGIGIPEDKLDAIFDSFTQAESYTTREHGGTGLGLSICKKLVSLMGGRIGVDSKLNEGATFFFTIPFKTVSTLRVALEPESNQFIVSPNETKGTKILVVEDNLVNQELALIYLNILNCACDLVNNGEEAIAILEEQTYDLILMDIQMPKMDGIAATLKIRENNQQTPIVAMTAHALSKEKEKCFEIGMNDYISKPFKIEALQEVILRHTKGNNIKKYQKKGKIAQNMNQRKLASNFAHLVAVMDGNQILAQELLVIFKGELVKFAQNMEIALQGTDREAIRKQVHKIKPNFELLQLMDLYDLGDQINGLVSEEAEMDEINALYQKIAIEIPNLLQQIEEEIKA